MANNAGALPARYRARAPSVMRAVVVRVVQLKVVAVFQIRHLAPLGRIGLRWLG